MTETELLRGSAILIFAATYLVIAVGRLPFLRLDRAGAALIGASLMVGSGVIGVGDAYRAIDLDTITLLLGMMIVVANLRLSGFFALVAAFIARHVARPATLLGAIILVSGAFSAFLVNDTICLVLTPLLLELLRRLRRNPVPYLLALAMSSNIGSAATITGNPQNIMIGSFSGIPYADFLAALAPVSVSGLVIVFATIATAYRGEIFGESLIAGAARPARANMPLVRKSVAITLAMIVAFFLVAPPAKVAICAGALLLLTRRLKPERIYRDIDWSLLLLFAGLFIVVAGLEQAVLSRAVLEQVSALRLDRVPVLSLVTAILSNLVSNVPAVLVLKPFIHQLAEPRPAWLTLAMASTLAGNFTILGSVANLIVVERARQAHIEIGFWAYFRLGAPVTLLTLLVGILWLTLR
jgi:Na+/H+ antiporter NhaD/arsenite permease-like protein